MLVHAGRAPEPHRQVRVLDQRLHARVRHVVTVIGQTGDGLRLDLPGRKMNADRRENRRGHDAHRPCGRNSVGSHGGLEGDHRVRPELVLAGVLFACPHKLDRAPYRFGDGNGLLDLIVGVAAAEAAADEAVVDIDLFRRQAGRLRRRFERFIGGLRSDPDIEPVGLQIHCRVHRLHRRMRQIGRLVDGLEGLGPARQGLIDIAVVARGLHGIVECGAIHLRKLIAVDLARLADVPLRLQPGQRPLGAPVGVGSNDRHGIVEFHHLEHARRAVEHGVIDALELAAGNRAGRDRGEHHAWNLRVDAEFGGAVGLVDHVDPRQRLGEESELSRRLDRRLGRECHLRRVGGELAETQALARSLMSHHALRCRALRCRNVPARRGGGNQALARAGADLLHLLLRQPHRLAAVREHRTVDLVLPQVTVGRSIFDPYLRPVAL